MARKKKETVKETVVVTRAEKKDATKNLIRELLAIKPHKHNELLDEVSKLYTERFSGEETDNVNDVKGRVGSVLDIMKKEGDVAYDGGMYALKARALPTPPEVPAEEKATKKTRAKKKTEESAVTEEKPKKEPKKAVVSAPVEEKTAAKPAVKTAPTGDAKTTFGLFLRSVRKTARNGVLITMCMDLDSEYEDGIFVLSTQSDTVYRSLCKDEHRALIAQALVNIGVAEDSFDIRLRGKKSDEFQKAVAEIKETFQGVKVDIK